MLISPIYNNQRIIVLGLGKTGTSIVKSLIVANSLIYVWDDNPKQLDLLAKFYVSNQKVHIIKNLSSINWREINAIVVSPGVPLHFPKPHQLIESARINNCRIASDIELFLESKREHQKVIGITGTNGKSTTTALIGHILSVAGKSIYTGGNIGEPILTLSSDADYYVIELSSYQLDLLNSINIDVGVLLNLSPDHIDRHGSMEHYAKVKQKLVNDSKYAVVACDDDFCMRIFDEKAGSKVSVTGTTNHSHCDIFLANKTLVDASEEYKIDNTRINLKVNAQNICAAFAACKYLKIPIPKIVEGINSFEGLRHRNQILGTIKNVTFVNDSKATNAQSTAKALDSYEDIFWILGGQSKAGGIESLKEFFPKIKSAFLIGEATSEFARTLSENKVSFQECGDLYKAVEIGFKDAMNFGESCTLVLSPACASWDQWESYEKRGDAFCDLYDEIKLGSTNT